MSGAEKTVSEPRPMASLTAGLLARRGGARPAMRRSPLVNLGTSDPVNDDLGWNDMGADEGEEAVQAPAPEMVAEPPVTREAPAHTHILDELSALADRIRQTAIDTPARTRKPRAATLTGARPKAAFTLRLDSARHLRLRLFSAVSKRSAQQLLVEALDEIFARNEQIRTLAEQIEADQAPIARPIERT